MATIVIDPGHYGGYNQGVCPGYYEGNTMLKLAKYLGTNLTAMGAQVIYTRTTNEENPSLAERGRMAANAGLFISLHSDAADDPSVRGVTSFYSVRQPESEFFASDIGNAAADAMGNQFRGTIAMPYPTDPTLDYFGVLRSAVAAGADVALLIEHGFHTNMEDCLFLSNDENLKKIAAAEAAVIAQYFDLNLTCTTFYTVQPGDSLYLIAQKFNVLWPTIAKANNMTYPYSLSVGQQILVPYTEGTASGCQFIYMVRAGDTLHRIGQTFGIPWQQIASFNNIPWPYSIETGQRIVIPLPMP